MKKSYMREKDLGILTYGYETIFLARHWLLLWCSENMITLGVNEESQKGQKEVGKRQKTEREEKEQK